jgi:hypothetical protein
VNQDSETIEIPISKTKLILMLIGSLAFVTIGILFITDPEKWTSVRNNSKELIFLGGIAVLGFFGLVAFYILKKLFDKRPGLVIFSEGIFDNSSATPVGLIEWKDIIETGVIKVHRQRIFLIKVIDPKKYINRQASGRERNVLRANHRFFGTPIALTSNGLKISFTEFEKVLNKKLEVYHQRETLDLTEKGE